MKVIVTQLGNKCPTFYETKPCCSQWLDARPTVWRHGFNPVCFYVGFMVDKGALEQASF
jgi:hypothetical protein